MLRVIYRWRIQPGREDAFVAAWLAATRSIKEGVPGARGSELLRDAEDPAQFLAVARWTDEAAWRAFRAAPSVDPDATAALRGAVESSEVLGLFDELADLTDRTGPHASPPPGAA